MSRLSLEVAPDRDSGKERPVPAWRPAPGGASLLHRDSKGHKSRAPRPGVPEAAAQNRGMRRLN